MHLLCIYKKTINLSLLKINRLLNFTMYILTILACPLKLRTAIFFFYQGFLSRTLTTHRTAGDARGSSFIRLYHFHLLRNIQRLFATLHVRWLSHIFNRTTCICQTATSWDLPSYRNTIWLIDDVTNVFVCLHDDLILAFFVTAIWGGKSVDLNSHRLSPLYYKRKN